LEADVTTQSDFIPSEVERMIMSAGKTGKNGVRIVMDPSDEVEGSTRMRESGYLCSWRTTSSCPTRS